jgi:hypothetical protein
MRYPTITIGPRPPAQQTCCNLSQDVSRQVFIRHTSSLFASNAHIFGAMSPYPGGRGLRPVCVLKLWT